MTPDYGKALETNLRVNSYGNRNSVPIDGVNHSASNEAGAKKIVPFGGRAYMAKREAVAAIVTGYDEQVGFRALVMKQAIQYNLAGQASNAPNNVVLFTLQGKTKRIDSALHTIEKGTKRSSDIKIKTVAATFDAALNDFTIPDWTSSSRNITTKYTLVFKLRTGDHPISPEDAKAAWHKILEDTLDPADQNRLQPDD